MRRGISIVELMVVLIIMSLIMTALYKVFSRAEYGAKEIIENHSINDKVDRVVLKITDDVREANYIYDNCPKAVKRGSISSLKTEDPSNYLMFMKVIYDFKKDPSKLNSGEVNYTQNRIKYFVEREEPTDLKSPWVLCREMLPFDSYRKPIPSQMKVFQIMKGIRECIFYRIIDPDAARSGNLYIKLKMDRVDKKENQTKYTNTIVLSVKERGARPE